MATLGDDVDLGLVEHDDAYLLLSGLIFCVRLRFRSFHLFLSSQSLLCCFALMPDSEA